MGPIWLTKTLIFLYIEANLEAKFMNIVPAFDQMILQGMALGALLTLILVAIPLYFKGHSTGYSKGAGLRTLVTERFSQMAIPTVSVGDVIEAIEQANPTRQVDNLGRRLIKIVEEVGEASEAYLNVTSAANGKNLKWADVREEFADAVIVAVDCAITPTPDQVQAGMTRQQVVDEFARVIGVKLAKWRSNRDTGKAATDAE